MAKARNKVLKKRHLSQTDWRASFAFIMPTVLALLFLSIFPLLFSLYLSLSRFKFARGGFELEFVGLENYKALLFGNEQSRFLGVLAPMTAVHWVILTAVMIAFLLFFMRYLRAGTLSFSGIVGRLLFIAGSTALAWLLLRTLTPDGRLGSLGVTLLFVFVGITLQYSLGLVLALLTVQDLKGRRFFRVVFLLPMMITPVGVAYMFRMITDTGKGPLVPIWLAMGLADFSWVTSPWGARLAIILADTWQWTPFMFIVLLAALESQPVDVVEAATVDGATPWQIFRHITWPAILPISLAVLLIRMIEAFKIIDLPNIMTNGGPGTATESLTLHAFISWRTFDLGNSAALAYLLLFVVTFFAVAFVHLIRQRVVTRL
ncbi:MAG: sugar ABC transporter permease [Anaerolineae bacterium]|nr:sugar ABC transporter permease [Anaerolineae bacterium]